MWKIIHLHFLKDSWCWAYFHVPVGLSYTFFWRKLIQTLCSFLIELFYFVLFLVSCNLVIFHINPLPSKWFENILFVSGYFSHCKMSLEELASIFWKSLRNIDANSLNVWQLFCRFHFVDDFFCSVEAF